MWALPESDTLLLAGAGVALVALLRTGGSLLSMLPLSPARRERVDRLRPLLAAALVIAYLVWLLRWGFAGDGRAALYAVLALAAALAVAGFRALRDLVEGLVFKVGRSCRVGDHVQIGALRGRLVQLGHRGLTIETAEGQLAIVPYAQVTAQALLRSPEQDATAFHVFHVAIPPGRSVVEAKRLAREAAMLCHWSSVVQPPQAVEADGGGLEVTVFSIAADRHAEIERAVRQALESA